MEETRIFQSPYAYEIDISKGKPYQELNFFGKTAYTKVDLSEIQQFKEQRNEQYKNIIEKNNNREINTMDYLKILDIYEKRVKEKIYQEEYKQIEDIEQKDVFVQLNTSYKEQFIKLYENEYKTECKVEMSEIPTFSEETNDKVKEIKQQANKKIRHLEDMLEEVRAHLNLIPLKNYDHSLYIEAIEILKNYEILDKKGKLNV